MSWEYKVVHIDTKMRGIFASKWDEKHVENYLNELGRNKWELVSFTPPNISSLGSKTFSAVLKRPR